MRSVADTVALGQVFLLVLLFPLSAPFHPCTVLILTYMLLTRTTARPANGQINNALPENSGSFDIHVTTPSLRLSLLGVQPGMRVHSELPGRPAPTDAALHRVKVRHRALTLQHLPTVIVYSNAIFLSTIHQCQNVQTAARRCQHEPGTHHVTRPQSHASHNVGLKHTSLSNAGYLATLNQHRYI